MPVSLNSGVAAEAVQFRLEASSEEDLLAISGHWASESWKAATA
jgi:hypothetical protein